MNLSYFRFPISLTEQRGCLEKCSGRKTLEVECKSFLFDQISWLVRKTYVFFFGSTYGLGSFQSSQPSTVPLSTVFIIAESRFLFGVSSRMSLWEQISINFAVLINLLVAFFYPFADGPGGKFYFWHITRETFKNVVEWFFFLPSVWNYQYNLKVDVFTSPPTTLRRVYKSNLLLRVSRSFLSHMRCDFKS